MVHILPKYNHNARKYVKDGNSVLNSSKNNNGMSLMLFAFESERALPNIRR